MGRADRFLRDGQRLAGHSTTLSKDCGEMMKLPCGVVYHLRHFRGFKPAYRDTNFLEANVRIGRAHAKEGNGRRQALER